MMKITTSALSGTPEGGVSTRTFEHVPDDPSSTKTRGSIFVLATTKQDNNEAAISVASRAYGTFRDNYYSYVGSSFDALVDSVDKVSISRGVTSFVAVSIVGPHLYSSYFGDVRLMLFRDAQLVGISNTRVSSVSGEILEDDKILLGTTKFFNTNTSETTKLLSEKQAKEVVAALLPKIHSEHDASEIGLFVLGVEAQMVAAPVTATTVVRPKLKLNFLPAIAGRRMRVFDQPDHLGRRRKLGVAPVVGMMLIGLLAVSIFFGLRAREEREYRAKYEPRLMEAQHQFEEAQVLRDLNPARARQLVLGVQDAVAALSDEGFSDPGLTSLSDQVTEGLAQIAGIYRVEPSLFMDLSIIRANFSGVDLAYSDGTIRILDAEGARAAEIEIDSKHTEVVAGEKELFNASAIEAYSSRTFVVSPGGIREIGDNVELFIRSEEWSNTSVLAKLFAGNVYLVDTQESEIWRYSATSSGFGPQSRWLAPGVSVDLSDARSIAIDGLIWILGAQGEIESYSRGNPQGFSLTGVDNLPTGATQIYLDDETEFLYILDSSAGRTLVVTKNGDYKAEYTSEALRGADDFVLSEDFAKLVFLKDGKLYDIELRHL